MESQVEVKQIIRQLRIQTGAVKRLTNDLKSYVEEKDAFLKKLEELKKQGADKYKLKNQRELLEETCAVILDTHGKVTEAYEKLNRLVVAGKEINEVAESELFEKGCEQLRKTHELLNKKKKKTASPGNEAKDQKSKFDRLRTISVFGSSAVKQDDVHYKMAVEIGEALAKEGFHIMNGGYQGIMEAVSKGAAKHSGAKIRGVLVPKVFPMRKGGNEYLTDAPEAASIEERLAILVGGACGFIVLPGSLGTLTELVMAWNTAVLAPLSGSKPPPIIAFRDPWEKVIKGVQETLKIPEQMIGCITFVDSAEDAIKKAKDKFSGL